MTKAVVLCGKFSYPNYINWRKVPPFHPGHEQNNGREDTFGWICIKLLQHSPKPLG